MASGNTITIKVVYSNSATSSVDTQTPSASPETNASQVSDQQEQSGGGKTIGNIVAMEAWNLAKTTLKNAGTYYLNRYFNLSEDYMGEQSFSNAMTTINKVVSFGTSVSGAAVMGSAAGPVGAAAAAAIAATAWTINEIVSITKNWQTARLTQQNLNYNTAFSAARAGLINGSKGTQN